MAGFILLDYVFRRSCLFFGLFSLDAVGMEVTSLA